MEKQMEPLEYQKQALIDAAEALMGKAYFEKLDKLSEDLLLQEEEKPIQYTLTTNFNGAFYASQERYSE